MNDCGDYWSAEFKNERALSDAIQSILLLEFSHKREFRCVGGCSRVDFFLKNLDLYLEAKVNTESSCMDRALGQALRYKVIDGKTTWIVTPNDVGVSDEQMKIAESIGATFIKISHLKDALIERKLGVVPVVEGR